MAVTAGTASRTLRPQRTMSGVAGRYGAIGEAQDELEAIDFDGMMESLREAQL